MLKKLNKKNTLLNESAVVAAFMQKQTWILVIWLVQAWSCRGLASISILSGLDRVPASVRAVLTRLKRLLSPRCTFSSVCSSSSKCQETHIQAAGGRKNMFKFQIHPFSLWVLPGKVTQCQTLSVELHAGENRNGEKKKDGKLLASCCRNVSTLDFSPQGVCLCKFVRDISWRCNRWPAGSRVLLGLFLSNPHHMKYLSLSARTHTHTQSRTYLSM